MTVPMRISVALCTYNGAAYLQEQLDSLTFQRRQPDEVIACDDGSDDNTPDVLYRFKKESQFPVRIYSNPQKLGTYKNFERAACLCTGDIVAYSDQDDVWSHDKLSIAAEVLENDPSVGLVIGDAEVVDEGLNILSPSLWSSLSFDGRRRKRFMEVSPFEALPSMVPTHGVLMAFRSEFRQLLFPLPPGAPHDTWSAVMIALCSEIKMVPAPLIKYRQHPQQQAGLRALDLKQRFFRKEAATRRILQNDLDLLLNARTRATEFGGADPKKLVVLESKLLHLEARLRAGRSRGADSLAAGLNELFNGGYHRYSNGLGSAARDLFW